MNITPNGFLARKHIDSYPADALKELPTCTMQFLLVVSGNQDLVRKMQPVNQPMVIRSGQLGIFSSQCARDVIRRDFAYQDHTSAVGRSKKPTSCVK